MASRGVNAMPLAVLHSPVVSPAGGARRDSASQAATRDSDASQSQAPPPKHRRRDHEASRMTAFPTPGFATTGGPVAPAPRTTGSVATKPAGRVSLDVPRSASMYWMPDHLCKTCYDCGASFSLFRRRHHCRLCGQIFCHACSSQFVDGTPHGFRLQMIRICKFCARYVTADAEKRQRLPSAASAASCRSSVEDASPLLQQSAPPAAPDASVPVSSPLLFSPVNAAAAVPLPEGDSMERLSDEVDRDAHALATGDDEILGRLPPVLFSIKSSESAELSPPPQTETPPEPVPVRTFRRPSLVRRRRSSLEFLNGNDQASTVATSASAELESVASSTEVPAETNADKPPPLDHETESFRVKTDLVTQREIVLDKYMTAAHERIREGIERSVDRSMKHFVGDGIEAKRLAASLEDMAFIVTGHLLFSMNFRGPNGFNFAGLVKVKSIATPSGSLSPHKDPYSFKWLAGCVCRKQLSHKQMARKIDNPRILLLACAISYDRSAGTGKLSSLDALIESEKSYMEILVEKISRLEPDIVFVERTVSRHAQEQLRERGIAIVLNVKRETLDRIARYTGATVLPSVDHVDQVRPNDVVGSCRFFYAQTLPVAVDDVPTTGPNATTATATATAPLVAPTSEGSTTNGTMNGNGVQRSASTRARTETYLYLDGCDPLNGCTVLITGPSKKKLKLLKTLMWSVLSMTYRTLLEAHMLSGLGLGFNDWYRRSLADQQERAAWCTTCTLRQYETVEGQLRYYQCSGSKQIGITPYAKEDISLGNFLAKEMEALSYRCHNPKCNYTMVDHVQTFSCTVGTVTVSFEELPDSADASAAEGEGPDGSYFNVLSLLDKGQASGSPSKASGSPSKASASGSLDGDGEQDCPVITYGKWCSECSALISPFAPLKKYAYKFSLARLLEILLSDGYPHPPAPEQVDTGPVMATGCTHDFMKSHVLFFNVGRIVARMDFTPRKPVRLFNTPTFVVVNGTRRCRSLAPGVPSSQGKESASSDLISLAASRRLTALASLLEKVVELFMERIHSIEDVVMTCEDEDGVATAVLIEVELAKKMVEEKQTEFADRLAEIAQLESSQERLIRTDHAKHVLYYIVCLWIEEMQKLRKTIRSSLAVEPEGSVAASSSFSLTGFSFSTPTTQSPVMSPRNGRLSSPRRSRPGSKSVTSYSVDERSRASSAALSFNSVSETNDLFAPDAVPSPKVVNKSMSTPVPSSQMSTSSTKSDSKESGWKSMLWDIYRAVGKSTPGDDFDLALPAELLDTHVSLTKPTDDGTVYLVSDTEPITFVAFALGSQSYEDQLPGWISAVQSKKVAPKSPPLSPEKAIEQSNSASGSEWTRAALTTTMHVHFKHIVVETPRHLALLYPSGSNTSGIWDFSVIAFFPLQFEALRELFYGSREDFLFSISHVNNWAALGGKSGASFYRTLDNRFVVKHISSTEQQSFLDVLPSYFEYMSKVFHEETPTVISKIVGMYQTTITKKDTGQRTTHHIVVMENVFFGHEVSKTFDLKGSSRNRYVKPGANGKPCAVELDGNFVEMTEGHPMGVIAEDHELLMSAIKNDAAFLTSINIVDFSLVLGLGGATPDMPSTYTHMTVGIIDYMRQFDLMKRVESVSKSVAMIAGQSSPTIIEPALYSKRFSDAIKRYFMPVTPIDSNRNDPYIPPSR